MGLSGRFGLLCVLAGLTSCANGPNSAPAAPPVCAVEKVADMPARVVEGAILIPGRINGVPVQMQIDTGATTSMIDPVAAMRLGLKADPRQRTTMHGIGGTVETQNALVDSFEIGGQEWQALSLASGHLAANFHEDRLVAGLLGGDRLSAFDVDLDIPHGRMTLWQVRNCAGNFAMQDVPHVVMPLERHPPNRMMAEVALNNTPMEALVDWGARVTTITSAAAAEAGVTPAMLAGDRDGRNWGVDRNENVVRFHRFATLRVGHERFQNPMIAVSDLHI